MATYKVIYTLDTKKWERYVDNVVNDAEAVFICDSNNPEIPREASVQVQLICE